MTDSTTPQIQSESPITSLIPGITNHRTLGLSLWEKRVLDVLLEVDFNWSKCSEVVKVKYQREFSPRQIERWVRGSRNGRVPGRAHLITYLQSEIAKKSELEDWDINKVKSAFIDIVENRKQMNELQMKALESIKDLELRKVAKDTGPKTAIQINFGERKE